MKAQAGDRIRLFFGVGGFVPSNLHVIGSIFDRVHPEGASEFLSNIQTTLVPAGGATVVEFTVPIPGTYVVVDHALQRALHKGAVAQIVVEE